MPAVVGVPVMAPVELLMDRPVGSPVAAYVSEPLLVELAETWRLTAVPTVEDWLPGLVTVTPLVGTVMWLPTLMPAKALPTPAYWAELVPYSAAAALRAAVRAEA